MEGRGREGDRERESSLPEAVTIPKARQIELRPGAGLLCSLQAPCLVDKLFWSPVMSEAEANKSLDRKGHLGVTTVSKMLLDEHFLSTFLLPVFQT